MGREPHILLAGLGLLAGAFFGVLSIKLLSPRPPVGAGVDIHDTAAISTTAEIVEPPTLSPPADGPREMSTASVAPAEPSALPTAAEEAVVATEPVGAMASDRYAAAGSSFATASDDPLPLPTDDVTGQPGLHQPLPASDPFARATRFDSAPPSATEQHHDHEFAAEEPQPLDAEAVATATPLPPVDGPPAAATAAAYVPAPAGHAPRHEVTHYVAAVGDSWWSLAERMYGDGRYYRALFAWNRAVNPRVSLVPGTPLELPPLSKLAVAWPALVPDE